LGEFVRQTPNGPETVDPRDVDRLAVALGLGKLQVAPANLKPADSNPVWAARTDRGEWIIKTEQPSGAWWFDAHTNSGRLELAVRDAGVAIATPADDYGDVGLWHDVGENLYARALQRLDGQHPTAPVPPEVARWTGESMAVIERVSWPAEAASDSGYRLYPEDQWREWIDEAVIKKSLDLPSAATLRSTIADLTDVILAGRALGLASRRLHRDVRTATILVTRNGPVLLDFDHAGPQVPWWEFVGHSFALATPRLGVVEPNRQTVRGALDAYLAAGGQMGQPDGTAFTGLLAAKLSYAAYLLWVASGHRGSMLTQQRKAAKGLPGAIACLPTIQASVPRWSTWLS
jgi:hypothetical protein